MRSAKLAAPRCASVGARDPRVASLTATPAAVLEAAAAKREGAEKRQKVFWVRFGRGGRAGEGAIKTAWGAREKLQKRPLDHHAPPLRASSAAFSRAAWASSAPMPFTRSSIAAALPAKREGAEKRQECLCEMQGEGRAGEGAGGTT